MTRVLRNYVFWTYERGSFHYDVMVTLILLFLFISPRFINFKDRPIASIPPHSSEVLVKSQGMDDGNPIFVYEIRAADLHGAESDADLRMAILNVVEPIAGNVTLKKYAPERDASGRIVAYDATVER